MLNLNGGVFWIKFEESNKINHPRNFSYFRTFRVVIQFNI